MNHSGMEKTIIGNAVNAFRDDMISGKLSNTQMEAVDQLYYLHEYIETVMNIERREREKQWNAFYRLSSNINQADTDRKVGPEDVRFIHG